MLRTAAADQETALRGLFPFCVEGCGHLTVGAASTTQLDDPSPGFLLSLPRPSVALASLARGAIAEGVVAYCLAASGCLYHAAPAKGIEPSPP
jgi:hypothetical protein